jgi:hypothetical protein
MLVRELKEWLDKNARDEDEVLVSITLENDPGLYTPEVEIKELLDQSRTNHIVSIST